MGPTQRKLVGGRAQGTDKPRSSHKAYMKLASLEMEKARQLQERVALTARIQTIEDRLRAIGVEQAALVESLPALHVTGHVTEAASKLPAPRVPMAGPQPERPQLAPLPPLNPKSEEAGDGRMLRFRY